jgi:ribosomal subunit interface protein
MKYNIEAPFNFSEKDKSIIEQKLDSLSKFNIGATAADIFFKEKDGTNVGDIHSEIRLYIKGTDIFAESYDSQAIVAFNHTFDAVKRQVIKLKEKRKDHHSDIKNIDLN